MSRCCPLRRGDYVALGTKTRPEAWAHWLKTHPSARRPTEIRYHDNHALMVEAASAGLGVALCPLVLLVDDVKRGSLAAPAGFDPDGSQYGLIWQGASELHGVELALVEWLQVQFSRLSPNV
jgi:DNA-binding transcriptional LysR family regulator